MGTILVEYEYDNVRAILGLDEADLSNVTLDLLPYVPAAEAAVKRRVTNYTTVLAAGGDDATWLKAAVAYRTAATLCDRLANTQREGEKLGDFTAGKIDWAARKAVFLAEYEAALGAISTLTQHSVSLLTLAGVSRTVKAWRDSAEGTLAEDRDFENI